jgi:hypothetical protein
VVPRWLAHACILLRWLAHACNLLNHFDFRILPEILKSICFFRQ